MAWRLYDWECLACGIKREDLVPYDGEESPPQEKEMWCEGCGDFTRHERLMPLVGKYLADRAHSPIVHGGKFDTAGKASIPKLPLMPKGSTYEAYRERYHTKEYQSLLAERKNKTRENKAKQARLGLIQSGANIDIRHNPLPGDPKI